MTFARRELRVTFRRAGDKTFTESGTNQVTLSNHRMSCEVVNAGVPSGQTANLAIYGVSLSTMNDLATLGMVIQFIPRNTLIVEAGDLGGSMSKIFEGTILNAWMDAAASPDVSLRVDALAGADAATRPVPPSSFQGTADVATVMQNLASQMGVDFENNGVTEKLSNCYFPGTLKEQAYACANHAGIGVDLSNGKLSIWKRNGDRGSSNVVLSPKDGTLIGYPAFIAQGIILKTLFNKDIQFMKTLKVKDSQLTAANGEWRVTNIAHSLAAQMPHGSWYSTLRAVNPAFASQVLLK